MKNITVLKLLLIVALLISNLHVLPQEKGQLTNVQATQRIDGSDTVDVYYDLAGYAANYNIQAYLYQGSSSLGIIATNFCSGDYGTGIAPGNNKHFAYFIGGHKPDVEWKQVRIEIRANFPMGNPCPGLASVEYVGVVYPTIQIGGQCWLQKNLNVGEMIPYQNLPWADENIEKYCYDNNPANCETYGALYHWWEAMKYGEATPGKQGICPSGFHIPTYWEYDLLVQLFGGSATAGGHLKSTNYWNAPNSGATNTSFFSALGAGAGYNTPGIGGGDLCYDLQKITYLFHSNLPAGENKPALRLNYNNTAADLMSLPVEPFPFGSVRCMKDCDETPSQANAGPDQQISNSNYAVLAAEVPLIGLGKWKVVSQHLNTKTGVIINAFNPNSEFYGYPGQTYTLAWIVSNECTQTYDECMVSFSAFTCGSVFTDHRTGKTYNTAQYGDNCWMTKNMDVGNMAPSLEEEVFNDGIIQKFCYNNDPQNCEVYGGLYYYGEAVQYQYTLERKPGICPVGWFVPRDVDWCNLTYFIDPTVTCSATNWTGTNAGGKMKETGYVHWDEPNTGATNSSGFTVLGSGHATIDIPEDAYTGLKQMAQFWTHTVAVPQTFYVWKFDYTEARVGRIYNYPYYNLNSVRCVYYPNY